MIVKRNPDIILHKGVFGREFYAKSHPNPNLVIVQRCPDRHLQRGKNAHPEVRRTNMIMLQAKEMAKAVYHDPVQRAAMQVEYDRLDAVCRQNGNRHVAGGKAAGGYEQPFTLWQWIYAECLRTCASANPKPPSNP